MKRSADVQGLSGAQVPEFLRTHPVTTNRIAESRDRAAQLTPKVTPESPSYAFVRERVRVLGAPSDSDLRTYYAALTDRAPLTPAQRYGQALAQLRAGERDQAASTLIELAAANLRVRCYKPRWAKRSLPPDNSTSREAAFRKRYRSRRETFR